MMLQDAGVWWFQHRNPTPHTAFTALSELKFLQTSTGFALFTCENLKKKIRWEMQLTHKVRTRNARQKLWANRQNNVS